jgi:hypothetical protein
VTQAAAAAWPWLERGFFAPVPAARLAAVRALVCFTALYELWLHAPAVREDALQVGAGGAARPWSPLYYVQVLGLHPLGIDAANGLLAVGTAALVAGMLGIGARVACAIGAAVFFWWTGLVYSFGKAHHDKVALAFALAALPWAPVGAAGSVDAWWRRRRRRARGLAEEIAGPVQGMPVWVAQFSIAVGYAGAGLWKAVGGGPQWFNGYTLQGHLLTHAGPWSDAFAASVLLCRMLSVGCVLVQALFPLVFVWPRACWFFLPAATSFHLLTWQTMDTGPFMTVWLLLWVFVPLERVPAVLARWWRVRPWLGAVALALLLAYVALVIAVAGDVLPRWALLGGAGVLGGIAWRARGWGGVIFPQPPRSPRSSRQCSTTAPTAAAGTSSSTSKTGSSSASSSPTP